MSWLSGRERFSETGVTVTPASAWTSIILSLTGAFLMFYGVEDMTLEFFIGVPLIVIAAIIVYKNHHKKQNSSQPEIKRENEEDMDTYFELSLGIAQDISAFYLSLKANGDFMSFLKERVHIGGDDSDTDLKLKASIMMDLKKCILSLGHPFNPTSKEGLPLFLTVTKIVNPKADLQYWKYSDEHHIGLMANSIKGIYRQFSEVGASLNDPFYGAQIFERYGNYKSKYLTLLYRYSSIIAKADGTVTDKEAKWLANIFNKEITDDLTSGNVVSKLDEHSETECNNVLDTLKAVAKFMIDQHECSVTDIRQRFGMGYAESRKCMEALEEMGIVGVFNEDMSRDILVEDEDELEGIFREYESGGKSLGAMSKTMDRPTAYSYTEPDNSQTDNTNIAKLASLIGLESVKSEVRTLANFVVIQNERAERGLKTSDVSYHCVFTGNPGTGKTTVARILAGIYKDLGILKKGHLVETDRSGLVAEYVGQTAVKTNQIIDSALDGVLFIDEAYSLISESGVDFGKEAVATLLKRMEDDRERLVVILAGYTNEMAAFINSNPGLQSRFTRYIEFQDYRADELLQIYQKNLKDYDYQINDDAFEKLRHIVEHAVANKDRNFGNARYVRNLFERTLQNQANRLSTVPKLTKDLLRTITIDDL